MLQYIASTCEDVVVALSEELRPAAMSVASKLRNKGRTVDLILDNKKLKWAYRHTERIGASRLVMIMPEEWKAGKIRIKDLKTGYEEDVSFIDL